MKVLFISLTLGLFAGCGTTVWEHPTKGMAYFGRDRSECTQQATNEEMAIDPHGGASIPIQDRVREYLRARGYVER